MGTAYRFLGRGGGVLNRIGDGLLFTAETRRRGDKRGVSSTRKNAVPVFSCRVAEGAEVGVTSFGPLPTLPLPLSGFRNVNSPLFGPTKTGLGTPTSAPSAIPFDQPREPSHFQNSA